MLHKLIKKFLLYFLIFVILSFVLGLTYINYLGNKTDELKAKRQELIEARDKLILENEKMQTKISQKNEEFSAIEDKIAILEEQIGLKPSLDANLDERIENIQLTSSQLQIIFAQIPNGAVIADNGVSASFGWRDHPILKKKEFHPGVDLRAPLMTPVYAPADGVVEYAGYSSTSGFGYLVILDHNFGFKTRFAHLSKKDVVKEGQFVKRGDLIGYSGNTGLSTGPHLHYEIRFIQRPLDPMNFIKWTSENFDKIFKEEKRVSWQSLIKIITTQSQRPL